MNLTVVCLLGHRWTKPHSRPGRPAIPVDVRRWCRWQYRWQWPRRVPSMSSCAHAATAPADLPGIDALTERLDGDGEPVVPHRTKGCHFGRGGGRGPATPRPAPAGLTEREASMVPRAPTPGLRVRWRDPHRCRPLRVLRHPADIHTSERAV